MSNLSYKALNNNERQLVAAEGEKCVIILLTVNGGHHNNTCSECTPHSSVSAAKKTKKDVRHTSVLFTGTTKLPNSAFCISKTTKPISTKFIYFLPYTLLHISKLKEIASAVLEIFVSKNCSIFFTFFFIFFAQNYKYI